MGMVVVHAGICPFGDNPVTTNQQNRTILLAVGNSAGTNLAGYLKLTFAGQTILFPANANTLGVRHRV